MALDLEKLRTSVAEFQCLDERHQARYAEASRQTIEQLRADLPTLCDLDLAAVSFYMARAFAALRHLSLRDASSILTDTAAGYSMGTAKLLGMIDA